MNATRYLTFLLAAIAFTGLAQSINQDELRFREAVHKEQVDGNLKDAIQLYQSLAASKDRAIAAKALLNLGRCHEKQGSVEARKAYEKLLSSFADQNEPAREARIRLAKLNPASVARTELSSRRLTRPLTTF